MVAHNYVSKTKQAIFRLGICQECKFQVINVACPGVKGKVESVSLSRRTVLRRMDEIEENAQDRLLNSSIIIGHFSGFLGFGRKYK